MHFPIEFLRWVRSFWWSSGVVQAVFALWVGVPMTLYLAERLWWLCHSKHWSMWVGLQYTVMDRELSACSVIKVSRKGIARFTWVPSIVNLITGSLLLMWSRNSCLLDCCWMTHVSSTNLCHTWGGICSGPKSSSFKTFPCTYWPLWDLWVSP